MKRESMGIDGKWESGRGKQRELDPVRQAGLAMVRDSETQKTKQNKEGERGWEEKVSVPSSCHLLF